MTAPVPFRRTIRALRSDRSFSGLALAVLGILMLAPWALWGIHASLDVVEISQNARVESMRFAVQTEAAGRVSTIDVELGRSVARGDVLATLDASEVEGRQAVLRQAIAALEIQLAAKQRQFAEIQRSKHQLQRLTTATLAEARAHQQATQTAATRASQRQGETEALHGLGVAPRHDLLDDVAEAERLQQLGVAARHHTKRVDLELAHRGRLTSADLEDLAAQRAQIAGQLEASREQLRAAQRDAERFVIRAPAAGIVTHMGTARPGEYVTAGQQLATLAESRPPTLVAWFPAASSNGVVAAGQRGRFHPRGFPWPQYDAVEVEVVAASMEAQDDLVRVELVLCDPPGHVRHGIEGTVELVIDSVSPVAFVLRALGHRLGPAPAPGGRS